MSIPQAEEKPEPMYVQDRYTGHVIQYNTMYTLKQVARHFKLSQGQLKRAIAREHFPRATMLKDGITPLWADTIIARLTRKCATA
jgi:hypothetical protein